MKDFFSIFNTSKNNNNTISVLSPLGEPLRKKPLTSMPENRKSPFSIFPGDTHKLVLPPKMTSLDEVDFLLSINYVGEIEKAILTIVNKMYGSLDEKFRQARAMYLYMYVHPGKKVMACCDQCLHNPHAVAADPGAIVLLDQGLGHLAVAVSRLNDMKIVLAAAQVNIRIAVVSLFCALVVGFDSANLRPLVFFESQNGILGVIRQLSLLFCHTMS